MPHASGNIKDGRFTIKKDKVHELFRKMIEEKLLSPKTKGVVKNHPKYYPFHHLIRHALNSVTNLRVG